MPKEPEKGKVDFSREFKHTFMNTRLPLEHPNYKEGKHGITITLQKEKEAKWGYFTAESDHIAELIKESPVFGKQVFQMTPADEKERLKSLVAKKPKYQIGVKGVIQAGGKTPIS